MAKFDGHFNILLHRECILLVAAPLVHIVQAAASKRAAPLALIAITRGAHTRETTDINGKNSSILELRKRRHGMIGHHKELELGLVVRVEGARNDRISARREARRSGDYMASKKTANALH